MAVWGQEPWHGSPQGGCGWHRWHVQKTNADAAKAALARLEHQEQRPPVTRSLEATDQTVLLSLKSDVFGGYGSTKMNDTSVLDEMHGMIIHVGIHCI